MRGNSWFALRRSQDPQHLLDYTTIVQTGGRRPCRKGGRSEEPGVLAPGPRRVHRRLTIVAGRPQFRLQRVKYPGRTVAGVLEDLKRSWLTSQSQEATQ